MLSAFSKLTLVKQLANPSEAFFGYFRENGLSFRFFGLGDSYG
jgi:hypothetical protein